MSFFMKKWLFIVSLFLVTLSVSSPAEAHRGWRWGRGWGLGTGLIVGGVIGSELSRPYYYPPTYVYSPPPVVVQQPVIVQQPSNYGPTVPQASVQTMWNYCESSRAYYPNVQSCPEGWKIVPATPSSPR